MLRVHGGWGGGRAVPPPQLQSGCRLQLQQGSIFNISAETLHHPHRQLRPSQGPRRRHAHGCSASCTYTGRPAGMWTHLFSYQVSHLGLDQRLTLPFRLSLFLQLPWARWNLTFSMIRLPACCTVESSGPRCVSLLPGLPPWGGGSIFPQSERTPSCCFCIPGTVLGGDLVLQEEGEKLGSLKSPLHPVLQGLKPMDFNGLADPYVKLHLLPGACKVCLLPGLAWFMGPFPPPP